jgi:small-conductance mechanosensitive channel
VISARACIAIAAAALLSSGCGYRLVRNPEVTAKRFAQDSVTMDSLVQQVAALRQQCRADSTRLEGELAASRAALAAMPAPVPYPDSLLKSRAAEIAGLKDQLAKTSAELDRIKRRLANPRG